MISFIWNVLQVEKQQSQKLCDYHLPVAYHLLPFLDAEKLDEFCTSALIHFIFWVCSENVIKISA